MATTLVTGASGFLGSHLVRALAERGDELRVLARRSSNLEPLDEIEFDRVTGDVTDRRAVRRALEGVERVFHVAGSTSLRAADHELVWRVNHRGARTIFEEALASGVERIVHTSTVGAIGIAKPGGTADETTPFRIGHLGLAYANSKHEAELEAFRLAAKGLPVVIVNPSFVLGPDAPGRSSMNLVRRFLLGRVPAYVAGALNVVDVRDVAAGHLLADEKGEVGERYILSGRNFTLDRLFADLSRISGVKPPILRMPPGPAVAGIDLARRLGVPLPLSSDEVVSASLWWTYRNTKAKRELGFRTRSHEETLVEAVTWQRDQLGDRVGATGRSQALIRSAAQVIGAIGGRIAR